jgi:hypothetical protein
MTYGVGSDSYEIKLVSSVSAMLLLSTVLEVLVVFVSCRFMERPLGAVSSSSTPAPLSSLLSEARELAVPAFDACLLRSRCALILLGTSFPSLLLSITCVIFCDVGLNLGCARWMWKTKGLKQQTRASSSLWTTQGHLVISVIAAGQTSWIHGLEHSGVCMEGAIGHSHLSSSATNGRANLLRR